MKSFFKQLILLVVTGLCWMPLLECRGELVDRIVAVVNNDVISLMELNQVTKPYEDRVRAMGYSPEKERDMLYQVREDMLEDLINQRLTDQEIRRIGIRVDETDVDAAIERVKTANRYTQEELVEGLKGERLTLAQYRDRLKEQILRARLVNLEVKSKVVITREDIREYYESHLDAYRGEPRYHLRNIILRMGSAADRKQRQLVEEQMERIQDELKGGLPFVQAAARYSDMLAEEGGGLGLFKTADLSDQVASSVMKLKPGEFTDVIKTDMGYQIFFLEEIVASYGKTLEDASAEIEDKLYSEIVDKKFKDWIQTLREQSHIKIIR